MTHWRLLVTEPLDGATNMAIDEAILLARIQGAAPPTVRFFSWDPPTLSLGYGQKLDQRINVEACRRLGVGLVRRPTGGSAIYHDTMEREVTYSVVAKAGDFEGADDLIETYHWIARGLLRGLQSFGLPTEIVPLVKPAPRGEVPTFCFARAGSYEIEVRGKKLVGSAQRRRKGAFLQHGSILLGADSERLRLLFPAADPLEAMTTVEAILGRRPTFDEMTARLSAGMEDASGVRLEPGDLLPVEIEWMERLVQEKYATTAWNEEGLSTAGIGARPLSTAEPRSRRSSV